MTYDERPLLAVANVARLRYPLSDARMSEFVDGIDRLNRLASESTGFVWRLRGKCGHSAALPGAAGGPDLIVNVTLWTDYLSLHQYTYRGLHGRYFTARKRWCDPISGPTTVLWWTRGPDRPDLEASLRRLYLLRKEGPSRRAFTVLARWNADGTFDRTSPRQIGPASKARLNGLGRR